MDRRTAAGNQLKKRLEPTVSSHIRTAHGSEGQTRTPTDSSAITFQKAPTSVPLVTKRSPTSSASSTNGRARGTAGRVHYKSGVLHFKVEFAYYRIDKKALFCYGIRHQCLRIDSIKDPRGSRLRRALTAAATPISANRALTAAAAARPKSEGHRRPFPTFPNSSTRRS